MNKYLTEFIGTFFLVLVIGLTGNPIAIGGILVVMVYMGGHISGAHYNPAVTLAVYMRKKLDAKDAMMYMIFQITGAILAAVIYHLVKGHAFAPTPAEGFHYNLKPLMIEMLFTFALTMVILNGAYNPAVAIGPILIDTIMGGSSLNTIWIYLVGPFVGSAIASIVYTYMNPEEK